MTLLNVKAIVTITLVLRVGYLYTASKFRSGSTEKNLNQSIVKLNSIEQRIFSDVKGQNTDCEGHLIISKLV